MSEAERSYRSAWTVVDHLVRFGMEHACVSPGSRSTPLALALWRYPHVEVHIHLDERASAFFALGIAKATGRPVAVATTSGTAVAELLPAVVEASMSRTTLVLLTADRPPELRGVGANQTIEQPGIFGSYVRASVDLPVPGDDPEGQRWLERVVEATVASMGPPPGPIHLNLPFREPLVPAPLELAASDPSGTEYTISEMAEPEEVAALAEALNATERGLILAGSLREHPPGLVRLAERLRWPLVAEPTSGSREPGSLAAGQQLLGDAPFVEAHRAEVVLQVGAAPTSRAGLELVRRAERFLIVDEDHLVADPHRRASMTVHAEVAGLLPEILDDLQPRDATSWWRAWQDADAAARDAVERELDRGDAPFEGRIARDVAASALDGSVLVVGSSMPVRDLDAHMLPRTGLTILANRGASGIDGFVSTALGVAASSERPTTALCGDLTFLHDAGSLLWNAQRGPGAVFVVVNNDGGAIFSLLEQRGLPEFEELFVTPHGLDLGALCVAARAGHVRVTAASGVVPVIAEARGRPGVEVVEVVVDAEQGRRRREDIRGAVRRALPST